MAVTTAKIIWIQDFLNELGCSSQCLPLWCNNHNATFLMQI
jgi:hypothetical protein